MPDSVEVESTKSEGTLDSSDCEVPLKPTNELDKRVSDLTSEYSPHQIGTLNFTSVH